jgi:membrane associated rhomboid family serine protease
MPDIPSHVASTPETSLSMLVALLVPGCYGLSKLFSVLSLYPGVSWQSHLGGALGGILAARIAGRARVPN